MRQQTSDQRPLRIGEVACIAQAIASIVRASGFGPWHRALHRIFANPTESQPAEITHCFFGFFGQALRSPPKAGVSKDGSRLGDFGHGSRRAAISAFTRVCEALWPRSSP